MWCCYVPRASLEHCARQTLAVGTQQRAGQVHGYLKDAHARVFGPIGSGVRDVLAPVDAYRDRTDPTAAVHDPNQGPRDSGRGRLQDLDRGKQARGAQVLYRSQRLAASPHQPGQQRRLIKPLFELTQCQSLGAVDPVQALDVAAVGRVKSSLGVQRGPLAIAGRYQSRDRCAAGLDRPEPDRYIGPRGRQNSTVRRKRHVQNGAGMPRAPGQAVPVGIPQSRAMVGRSGGQPLAVLAPRNGSYKVGVPQQACGLLCRVPRPDPRRLVGGCAGDSASHRGRRDVQNQVGRFKITVVEAAGAVSAKTLALLPGLAAQHQHVAADPHHQVSLVRGPVQCPDRPGALPDGVAVFGRNDGQPLARAQSHLLRPRRQGKRVGPLESGLLSAAGSTIVGLDRPVLVDGDHPLAGEDGGSRDGGTHRSGRPTSRQVPEPGRCITVLDQQISPVIKGHGQGVRARSGECERPSRSSSMPVDP
ncbi:MAG: hypothetical protein ACI9WU_001680 [Myxococcota bacterium]|jgi:hypothetical protein